MPPDTPPRQAVTNAHDSAPPAPQLSETDNARNFENIHKAPDAFIRKGQDDQASSDYNLLTAHERILLQDFYVWAKLQCPSFKPEWIVRASRIGPSWPLPMIIASTNLFSATLACERNPQPQIRSLPLQNHLPAHHPLLDGSAARTKLVCLIYSFLAHAMQARFPPRSSNSWEQTPYRPGQLVWAEDQSIKATTNEGLDIIGSARFAFGYCPAANLSPINGDTLRSIQRF